MASETEKKTEADLNRDTEAVPPSPNLHSPKSSAESEDAGFTLQLNLDEDSDVEEGEKQVEDKLEVSEKAASHSKGTENVVGSSTNSINEVESAFESMKALAEEEEGSNKDVDQPIQQTAVDTQVANKDIPHSNNIPTTSAKDTDDIKLQIQENQSHSSVTVQAETSAHGNAANAADEIEFVAIDEVKLDEDTSNDIPDLTECHQSCVKRAGEEEHGDSDVPVPDALDSSTDDTFVALRQSINLEFAECIQEIYASPAIDEKKKEREEREKVKENEKARDEAIKQKFMKREAQSDVTVIVDPDNARKDNKCLICHVSIPDDKAWKQHKSGGPHVKKAPVYEFIKRGEGFKRLEDGTPSSVAPTFKGLFTAMGEDTIYEWHMRNENGKAEFVLWACSVCCCASPSVLRAKEHIKSDQHRLNYLDENYPALKAKLPNDLAYVPRKLNHIAGMVRKWKDADSLKPQVFELTISSNSLLVLLGLKQATKATALKNEQATSSSKSSTSSTPASSVSKVSVPLIACPVLELLKEMSTSSANGLKCILCCATFDSASSREWHDRSSNHRKKLPVFNFCTGSNNYFQIGRESCVAKEMDNYERRMYGEDSIMELYDEGATEMILWICTVCLTAGKNVESCISHITTHAHAMLYLSFCAPYLKPQNENSFKALETSLIRAFDAFSTDKLYPTCYKLKKDASSTVQDLAKRWDTLGILDAFYLNVVPKTVKSPVKTAQKSAGNATKISTNASTSQPLSKSELATSNASETPKSSSVMETSAAQETHELIIVKSDMTQTKSCGLCRCHFSNKGMLDDHNKTDMTHISKMKYLSLFQKQEGLDYEPFAKTGLLPNASLLINAKASYKWILGEECIHQFFVQFDEKGVRRVWPLFWACSVCFVGSCDELIGKSHLISHSHQMHYLEDYYPSLKPAARARVPQQAAALVDVYNKIQIKEKNRNKKPGFHVISHDVAVKVLEMMRMATNRVPNIVLNAIQASKSQLDSKQAATSKGPFDVTSLDHKLITNAMILKPVSVSAQAILNLNVPIRRFDNNCQVARQLCSMTVQGPNAWDTHLRQQKHNEREAVYGFLKGKATKFSVVTSFNSAINFTFPKTQTMIGDCAIFELHPKTTLHGMFGSAPIVEEVVFWACAVCFIARSDPNCVKDHLLCNEHRLNYIKLLRPHLAEDINVYGSDLNHPSLTRFLDMLCMKLRSYLTVEERKISVAILTVDSDPIMKHFNLTKPSAVPSAVDFRVKLTPGNQTVLKRMAQPTADAPSAKVPSTSTSSFAEMAKMMKQATHETSEPKPAEQDQQTTSFAALAEFLSSAVLKEKAANESNTEVADMDVDKDEDEEEEEEEAVLTLTGTLRNADDPNTSSTPPRAPSTGPQRNPLSAYLKPLLGRSPGSATAAPSRLEDKTYLIDLSEPPPQATYKTAPPPSYLSEPPPRSVYDVEIARNAGPSHQSLLLTEPPPSFAGPAPQSVFAAPPPSLTKPPPAFPAPPPSFEPPTSSYAHLEGGGPSYMQSEANPCTGMPADTVARVTGLLKAWKNEEAIKKQMFSQIQNDSTHDIAMRLVNILKDGKADLSDEHATSLISELMRSVR